MNKCLVFRAFYTKVIIPVEVVKSQLRLPLLAKEVHEQSGVNHHVLIGTLRLRSGGKESKTRKRKL